MGTNKHTKNSQHPNNGGAERRLLAFRKSEYGQAYMMAGPLERKAHGAWAARNMGAIADLVKDNIEAIYRALATEYGEGVAEDIRLLVEATNANLVGLERRPDGQWQVQYAGVAMSAATWDDPSDVHTAAFQTLSDCARSLLGSDNVPLASVSGKRMWEVFNSVLFPFTQYDLLSRVQPYALPFGSFVEGTSTDEDYAIVCLPPTVATDVAVPYNQIVRGHEKVDVIEIMAHVLRYQDGVPDDNRLRSAQAMQTIVVHNLLKDYKDSDIGAFIQQHYASLMAMDLEDALEENVRHRKQTLETTPTPFNMRKYVFAALQRLAYQKHGVFLNRKREMSDFYAQHPDDIPWDGVTSEQINTLFFGAFEDFAESGSSDVFRHLLAKITNLDLKHPVYVYSMNKQIAIAMAGEGAERKDVFIHGTSVLVVLEDGAYVMRETTCDICSRGSMYVVPRSIAVEPRINGVVINSAFVPAAPRGIYPTIEDAADDCDAVNEFQDVVVAPSLEAICISA